jgi:hypothetical protein
MHAHEPGSVAEIIDLWEQQQDAYVTKRGERFAIILDAIHYARPEVRTILDIGGGLGSFSKLLLDRFPAATVTTLDNDPAMLELAGHHLRDYRDRSVLVEADLVDPGWPRVLHTRPEVIVASTALHWVSSAQLVGLYGELATVLGKGGLFFNADHLAQLDDGSFFHTVSSADGARQQGAFDKGVPDWDGWWERLRAMAGFTALVDERDRRFADSPHDDVTPTLQVEALRVVGFAEAGTLWQYFDDYVVYGVR